MILISLYQDLIPLRISFLLSGSLLTLNVPKFKNHIIYAIVNSEFADSAGMLYLQNPNSCAYVFLNMLMVCYLVLHL